MRKSITVSLLAALGLTLAPALASADDFAPPPWLRADPRAVTAEWEFLAPLPVLAPDGPLTNVGATAFVYALAWGIGDGDGGWFFGGGDIIFNVENIIDTEPVKHLWVQVTHTPGLGLAMDPLGAGNFGATGSLPGAVTTIPAGPTHTIFTWDMFPNPPWETFRLVVFGHGEIDQVLVDTISVPEPSTFMLCGIGLLSLGIAARRRRMRA